MDQKKDDTQPREYNAEEDPSEGCNEPQRKLLKMSAPELSLNPLYMSPEFTESLKAQWNRKSKADYVDPATGLVVYTEPYQLCLLPDFIAPKGACLQLVDEMIEQVRWSRKQMDMYEFYQSLNMPDCPVLHSFSTMLEREVLPWLEKVTNLKLNRVSASCSMYTCGDYLLVHDDLLKDRQVAFIYYLSPWQGAEEWSVEQGGCLEIFDSNEGYFPQFPVKRRISPKNNQFAFFKVGSRSFHQVGEVTNYDYPRLTINGWFHGASNDDLVIDLEDMRPFTKLNFKEPLPEPLNLSEMLNEVYLKPATRKSIQKRIEDNSEICLYEFVRRELFEKAASQLLTDDALRWRRQGPANAQNYEVLEMSTASATIKELMTLFSCSAMFDLLRDYTDLDLAGPNASHPGFSMELQRWTHGNYTMLGDGAICEVNTLDLLYYLNATEGAGVITYLSPDDGPSAQATDKYLNGQDSDEADDDSVLLTITPVDNALNIVYRCVGTTKFTKYVSRNMQLEKGPVFVISCSYKE